jgi:hypothetical protein
MKTLTKTLLLTGILGLASLMTSCQTAPADATSAVTCDKCKSVWVQRPVPLGPWGKSHSYYALRAPVYAKVMDCPECESAVATFFKTGKLQHRCSHCGGVLVHCASH